MNYFDDHEDSGPLTLDDLNTSTHEPAATSTNLDASVVWNDKSKPLPIPQGALDRFYKQNNLEAIDTNVVANNLDKEYYQIKPDGDAYIIEPKRVFHEDELFNAAVKYAKDITPLEGGKRRTKKQRKSKNSKKQKKSKKSRKQRKH